MEFRKTKLFFTLPYILVGLSYSFIGIIAAHPFDDAIYAYNSQMFYYLHGNPFIYLPQGIFYDAINVAGYFPTALISIFLRTNVLLIQFGVKIPFILFTLLASYVLYHIAATLKLNGRWASLLLLTSPIYFFTSVVYGSAIVVSMFFLLSGLYLALRQRTIWSAVMYGISLGTYLYPVFAIPVFARYLWVRKGRREALIFLFISSLVGAIGQFTVLFLFVRTGQLSLSPNNPYGYLSPYTSVPYYDIFDFLNVFGKGGLLPGQIYNILYYGASIVLSLSYFLVRRQNVNDETLITFLLVQGVLFAALAPYNLPSYMVAMIPLAIIVSLLLKRWIYIGMMWISTFFSFTVMQTINNVGFIVYFSDLNMKILTAKIYQWSSHPAWINSIAGSLYVASLLAFIPIALLRKRGNLSKLKKSFVAQSATIGVIVVVGVLLLVPVASSIPQNMYLAPSVDYFTGYASSAYLTGTSIVATYDFPILGSMSQEGRNYFLGQIEYPDNYYLVYDLSRNSTTGTGAFTQHITLPYPLKNATFQLSGNGYGNVSMIVENSTSSLVPLQIHSPSNNSTIYKFDFNTYISGKYTVLVNSSVPIFLHNDTSLALSIGGIPAYGVPSINNGIVSNGIIVPYQLGGTIVLKYSGPFYGMPKDMPTILVYMIKPLGKPVWSQLSIGGLLFVSLIVFPPSAIIYLWYRNRKRRASNEESQA